MTQTTIIRHIQAYPLKGKITNNIMDSAADKEERKREYNRLAQREFRRRRKEHLKSLEMAQKEQSSEQSEEIERLRYQNDELRRENEALRAQVFGSAPSSSHGMLSAPVNVSSMSNDGRSYSLSPSISVTSLSGAATPPSSMGGDMMPMAALSLTSSMMPPNMQAYADSSALTSQPYRYRNSRSAVGPSFQSMNMLQSNEAAPNLQGRIRSRSSQPSNSVVYPYDGNRARAETRQIFRSYYSDMTINSSPERHLSVLRSLSDNLPTPLKPSKRQLETSHYWGIDMVASPSIRDKLLSVGDEVAKGFIDEIGIIRREVDDVGQLTIWGDDPLDENSWEFSQEILERWGWLLRADWVNRANHWRRRRGATPLPDFREFTA